MVNLINRILYKLLNPLKVGARYSVKIKRKIRIKKLISNDDLTLELMGGNRPISYDNLNIDASDSPYVDIVHNFPAPLPFEDNSVSKVITIAAFEHFNLKDIRLILKDIKRILKPDGNFEICVPLLEKIFKQYNFEGCSDILLRYLFGAQKDKYDIHLCIMDFERWKKELNNIGFKNIHEKPYEYDRHSKKYIGNISGNK